MRTPDGLLRLIVCRDSDGDLALGFEGFRWHTHASVLAVELDVPEDQAVRKCIYDLLSEKLLIAVSTVAGTVQDAWVVRAPDVDNYKPNYETITFRSWAGRVVES